MSYEGAYLPAWFVDDPVRVACLEMANRGGERMVELTRQNTPIDDSPQPSRRPGTMRESWKQKRVTRGHSTRSAGFTLRTYESGVETDDPIAPLIESGWGLWGPYHRKYPIRPRRPGGWLHWIDRKTGDDRFARLVMHPGAPGQHMIATAAAKLEAEAPRIMAPVVRDWARTQERMIHRGATRKIGRVTGGA